MGAFKPAASGCGDFESNERIVLNLLFGSVSRFTTYSGGRGSYCGATSPFPARLMCPSRLTFTHPYRAQNAGIEQTDYAALTRILRGSNPFHGPTRRRHRQKPKKAWIFFFFFQPVVALYGVRRVSGASIPDSSTLRAAPRMMGLARRRMSDSRLIVSIKLRCSNSSSPEIVDQSSRLHQKWQRCPFGDLGTIPKEPSGLRQMPPGHNRHFHTKKKREAQGLLLQLWQKAESTSYVVSWSEGSTTCMIATAR